MMTRSLLRPVIAMVFVGTLVACNPSNPEDAATGDSPEGNNVLPVTSSGAENSERGNFGNSLGDMQYTLYRNCMVRNGDDAAFEDRCKSEADHVLEAAGRNAVVDAGGREWSYRENRAGAVVSRDRDTIYLGVSCDAGTQSGETGQWERINGRFTVFLPDRTMEFRGYVMDTESCFEQ